MTFENQLKEEMFRRVLVFSAGHLAQLPPAAGRIMPKIQTNADRLIALGSDETSAETDSKSGTKDRGAAFGRLKKQMMDIHETALSIDHDDDLPDVGHDFLVPANRRLSTWLAFGKTYIDKATPIADHFVDYGMAPDFLETLATNMEAAKAAENSQDSGDLAHGSSVKEQNDLADATVKLVRGLGQSVKNRFGDDDGVMAEWDRASKIEDRAVHPKIPPLAAV